MTVATLAVLRSTNGKTGPVAVTYRDRESCPSSCPLLGAGCYAAGRIAALPAQRGKTDPSYQALRDLASTIPAGGGLRANVVGDLLDADGNLDEAHASALSHVATSRPDVAVWSYTHAWRDLTPEPVPGAVVNASCETAEDVAEALAAGWQATVVDDPDAPLAGTRIAGRPVVTCPAVTGRAASCDACRLCASDAPRRAVVAFPVHGSGARLAAATIRTRKEA